MKKSNLIWKQHHPNHSNFFYYKWSNPTVYITSVYLYCDLAPTHGAHIYEQGWPRQRWAPHEIHTDPSHAILLCNSQKEVSKYKTAPLWPYALVAPLKFFNWPTSPVTVSHHTEKRTSLSFSSEDKKRHQQWAFDPLSINKSDCRMPKTHTSRKFKNYNKLE